ncbi:MAG: DUF4345 domain-containing protein [Pseudomonadota bacterium]
MQHDQSVLLFNSVVFVLVGLAFLLFPEQTALRVTDSSPSSASGLIDMRATYGGVLLGVGFIFHLLNRLPQSRANGLRALIAVLGGMAVGRIAGMLIDGPANFMMYLFLVYELVFIGLSWAILRKSDKV